MKLLITGVPGTGKTIVARHLETQGFSHVNMEQEGFRPRYEFEQDPPGFLDALPPEPVVVTWGFGPFANRDAVSQFRAGGFRAVWLDGNRAASFREFMRRERDNPVKEADYYDQMRMIVVTEIVQRLAAPLICPFNAAGWFRPVAEIAADVLEAAGHD